MLHEGVGWEARGAGEPDKTKLRDGRRTRATGRSVFPMAALQRRRARALDCQAAGLGAAPGDSPSMRRSTDSDRRAPARQETLSSGQVWRLSLRRVSCRRCPQCGRGELFARWARLCERCGVCGLVYRREDGAELGSMTLIAVASELFAAALFMAIWLGTDWGALLALSVSIPAVLLFSYALVPWSMVLWVAVEYATDVGNGEWWARPRA